MVSAGALYNRAMRFLVLLLFPAFALAQGYDLLLDGGRVIDPKNGVDAIRDVGIRDGRIAAVAPELEADSAERVIDASGLVVTPGLVDIHFHAYAGSKGDFIGGGNRSIFPDHLAPRSCTTTVVDPGSSGWRNFEEFRRTVIERTRTRTLAMLNIVGTGMLYSYDLEQNPNDMSAELTAAMAEKHKDVVVGIKAAHWRAPDFTSVERAVAAGELADIPVMVDFGYWLPERPYETMISEILRPGDMSTHFYRWLAPLLNEQNKPRSYLFEARKRGVKFDVGHGAGSFHFRVAQPMVEAGFYPDSISTDVHLGSINGGMIDMPSVMSKFLVMGMPLEEVIRTSTVNPAAQAGHPELGQIAVGAEADVALLEVADGTVAYRDVLGGSVTGTQRIGCVMTIREGAVYFDRDGLSGVGWEGADLPYPER